VLDLLFLSSSGPTLPSVRFRVLPYVREAERRGLAVRHLVVPKTLAGRLGMYATLPAARAVVLQKKLLPKPEVVLLRRRCRFLAFDFDDALWTCHPNAGEVVEDQRSLARLEAVCRAADLVIAGNAYLAERVEGWSSRVEVLPTPLDTDAYAPPERREEGGKVTVGWMGTSCNLFFLPDALSAMAAVPGIRLLVVSDGACALPAGLEAEFRAWSAATEAADLQAMDIGLMPLTDDPYTRGKCGFKLLQYMASGAVPVASDVGFNCSVVTDGKDGFLVRTPDEFAERVALLASDVELRKRMALAARRTVEERFSLQAAAERLLRILALK